MREVSIEEQAENAENILFGDDRLGVMFYVRTVEDHERTRTEGRKCFKDREYVKIMVPGDRQNVVDRPVQRTGILPTDDVMRFPKQYSRFKNSQDQIPHEGTPLGLWPQMPSALAEELRYINIFTVEQLAELSDTYTSKLPMGQKWKQKASEFVKALTDQEQVNKLQSQLEERDLRISTLELAVKEQSEKIDALLKKMK